MFVTEAAIPECSGGTTVRGVEVTGTSMTPNPTPAMERTQLNVARLTWGPRTALVSRIPLAARTQPTVIGVRGPCRATQGPVMTEEMISPAAIGMNVAAVA